MTPDLSALLEALDAKRRAATPGRRTHLKRGAGETASVARLNAHGLTCGELCTVGSGDADAAYIAALPPEVVGAFIDCVRALQDIKEYWGLIPAPKSHYIDDRCDEALAALAARLGEAK